MREVVIVEAVRSPIGRRGGELSTMHSVDLLAEVQKAAIERSGIDPAEVGQVVGGCVSQVGMQAFNVARTAWLTARPAHLGGGHDGRRPVRLVAAGHQPRHLARRQRRRRRRPRLWRRGDEPGADGLEHGLRASARPCPSPTSPASSSPRSSRAPSSSPRSGASAASSSTSSASARRTSPPRRGPRAASRARSSRSTRPTSATTASPPAAPTTSARTAGCARPPSRVSPRSRPSCSLATRSSAPRAGATPPAPRRRSPTAPAPCC